MAKLLLQIRNLFLIHFLVTGVLTLGIGVVWGPRLAASFALGAVVMGFSTAAMAWTTARVLTQKTFALTAAIIVIKYAVLLGTLYFLAQSEWLHPLAVIGGVSSFMASALLFGILERKE